VIGLPATSVPSNDMTTAKKNYGTSTKFGSLLTAIPGGSAGAYSQDQGNAGASGGGGGTGGLGLAGFLGGGGNLYCSGGGATAAGTSQSSAPTVGNPRAGGAGLVLYVTGAAVEYGRGGSTYGENNAGPPVSLPGQGAHATSATSLPGAAGFRGEVVVRVTA
jgi:hypothetical protein